MQTFEIKNPRVLSILENIRYLYRDKYDPSKTNRKLDEVDDPYYVSSEYRDYIVSLGTEHDGSPATAKSYPIKPEHYMGDDPNYAVDFARMDSEIKTELGLKLNALSQLYPPTGYISWHTNANAPGYNLIFTWSETGDGWFKYLDKYGREVTLQDKQGWTLKAGYFGTYEEKKECYHAAYTDCWRMTHSFVLGNDYDYWKDCIDYITGD